MRLVNIFYSSLFRSSAVYTITAAINAGIPLLLLPVLTTKLSPSDYGIIAMFQLVASLIYPIFGMNLESSVARKYFDDDNSDFSSYLGTSLILVFINTIVTGTLYLFLFKYISDLTLIPLEWIKFTLLVVICQFLSSVILTTYQVRIKPISYGVFQIGQSIINITLTIIFVVVLEETWRGRLSAQIYTGILSAIVSLILLFGTNQIKINVKISDVKHALSFGLPLIPHVLGGLLFTAVDRFFLTNMLGLEQTGNYSVAYQLGAIISLVTLAFNNAFTPWLYGELNKNSDIIKLKIVRFTYLYFILISLFAVTVIYIFPILVNIFIGERFTSISSYSTFIIWGFVFQGMYYMVTNYIGYVNKTYLLAIITISVAIIKIPLTYFLINTFGAPGASISYCITFLLFFLLTWVLSAKVYKMPWFDYKIIT